MKQLFLYPSKVQTYDPTTSMSRPFSVLREGILLLNRIWIHINLNYKSVAGFTGFSWTVMGSKPASDC